MEWLARYDEVIAFLLNLSGITEAQRPLVAPYLYYGVVGPL